MGERLCSNCKKPGHYAKTCKAPKAITSPTVSFERAEQASPVVAEPVSKPPAKVPFESRDLGYDPHNVVHTRDDAGRFACGSTFGKFGAGWHLPPCPGCVAALAVSQPVK